VLAAIGGLYAISALVIFARFVAEVWSNAATLDRLLQFALLASGAWGIWLLMTALENLGVRSHRPKAASIHR
jgi:hypothetical protein